MYIAETGYQSKCGYTIRNEEVVYRNGKIAIIKYYKAEGEDVTNDSQFEKDSTWVYFDKSRDTIKIEIYKNGKLIKTKQYK